MAGDLQQIRNALRLLGFEVACADSVLIGDQPVAIADIARHGLPWVLATFFSMDAGPTPPSPGGGYPLPPPPIGTALPAPRRKHLPQIPPQRPPQPLEELSVEDLWGDSTVWGESNVDGDDVELIDPFEAGFREDQDIDGSDIFDSDIFDSEQIEQMEAEGEQEEDDDESTSTLIVWVPEEISRRLVELLGGDGTRASRDPKVLLKLIRLLRSMQGENGASDAPAHENATNAAGFLASLEERLRDSLADQDPLDLDSSED